MSYELTDNQKECDCRVGIYICEGKPRLYYINIFDCNRYCNNGYNDCKGILELYDNGGEYECVKYVMESFDCCPNCGANIKEKIKYIKSEGNK